MSQSVEKHKWISKGYELLEKSVQFPTKSRYAGHWKKWNTFIQQFHLDNVKLANDFLLINLSMSEKVDHIVAFLAYLFYECTLKKETISNILSGIKHTFSCNGQETVFFENPIYSKILKGMKNCDVQNGKIADQKKPMPLEMIRSLVDRMTKKGDIESKMLRVAALMAYFMLLRQSEYLFTAKGNNHAIKAKNVEFKFLNESFFVQSQDIGFRQFHDLESIRVTLPHCKNDPFHSGNQFWYEAGNVLPGQFDLVLEVFNWAMVAHLQADDTFISYRNGFNKSICLTYYRVMAEIHITATHFGMEPNSFGTHSWRIAGATTLDAAQVPMECIQKQGRWKTIEMPMYYSKSNRVSFNNARSSLAKEDLFTVKDLLYHTKSINKK